MIPLHAIQTLNLTLHLISFPSHMCSITCIHVQHHMHTCAASHAYMCSITCIHVQHQMHTCAASNAYMCSITCIHVQHHLHGCRACLQTSSATHHLTLRHIWQQLAKFHQVIPLNSNNTMLRILSSTGMHVPCKQQTHQPNFTGCSKVRTVVDSALGKLPPYVDEYFVGTCAETTTSVFFPEPKNKAARQRRFAISCRATDSRQVSNTPPCMRAVPPPRNRQRLGSISASTPMLSSCWCRKSIFSALDAFEAGGGSSVSVVYRIANVSASFEAFVLWN
jgi:hypothetical protein